MPSLKNKQNIYGKNYMVSIVDILKLLESKILLKIKGGCCNEIQF